jgi:ABC-type nitrate/sulfonate/bicarbonate transport system substrate-binding protein
MFGKLKSVLSLAAILAAPAIAQAQTKINLGTVQSFGAVTTYIAREKGYFKDVGIDIDIVDMNSSANVLAILARGDLQIVEGGVSAGFFNALEQNLPVIMVADRVSTPIGHQMIVAQKNQGKISKLQDLKGLTVGSNGPGSITTYEVGKMLETVGMKLDDVDIKILGFSQMGPALASGALDAALVIPPFAAAFEDQKIGYSIASVDALVKPTPMTIAVAFMNTEWAAKNKDAAQRFFVAYMRATRDYCVAYHGGPNRKEVIDIALKNGLDKSAESLEKNIWTGRTMDGVIKVDSMLDIQDYYKKVGLTKATFPADRIVTREFVDYANQKLGPPPKTNPDSKLENCR